jgi:uncharacterized membrane protein
MNKDRLIAFTDAVLAIIMTILVLELERPAAMTPAAFWALRENFFAYTLSFFWLGSLWVGLNSIWEAVRRVNSAVIWWNMLLLFFASFVPYATILVSQHFESRMAQGFYGVVVIVMTVVNAVLHRALDAPNRDAPALLAATKAYRRLLWPDIGIKAVGFALGMVFYPPMTMGGVLLAAAFILTGKRRQENQIKAKRG